MELLDNWGVGRVEFHNNLRRTALTSTKTAGNCCVNQKMAVFPAVGFPQISRNLRGKFVELRGKLSDNYVDNLGPIVELCARRLSATLPIST